MTRKRKYSRKEDRSPFGKMLHELFLEKDRITQAQLARASGVAAETISRMMQSSRYVQGEFAQGKTLTEQLYAIFKALNDKQGWNIHLQSDEVGELLQEIP